MNDLKNWIGLLALFLLVVGCGGEAEVQAPSGPTDADETPRVETLAMVVETSEPTYWHGGEEVSTIEDVQWMVLAEEPGRDAGYMFSIDESYERAGQLRVVFTKTPDARADVDLKKVVDGRFERLKQRFDQQAEAAALEEQAQLRAMVDKRKADVATRQKALTDLQTLRRGLPSTDESRLEMRKLNRQIEVALAEVIALEKAVEQAERRNDRKRYVTLMRVR
ncbi:MAG: hypothetical protein AAGB26_06645 [Planctomycetota bacterium]